MLHFKLSKATLKTLASFHGIRTVSADVIPIFEAMILEFVCELVSKSLEFATKRTIPVRRLYLEDVQNACILLFKRKPLTLVDNSDMSIELEKKITPEVVDRWTRIMKPDDKGSIFGLQLHYSSFHKLIENILSECGFEIQIGRNALLLIQNETEYFLYAVLNENKKEMVRIGFTTLSKKIYNKK